MEERASGTSRPEELVKDDGAKAHGSDAGYMWPSGGGCVGVFWTDGIQFQHSDFIGLEGQMGQITPIDSRETKEASMLIRSLGKGDPRLLNQSRTARRAELFTVAADYRGKNRYLQKNGAGNETRTRDPNLGKVVLYQLSYSRVVQELRILGSC